MLVPKLLEEAAAAVPERKALVVVGCEEMTYRQWADRAQRIAQHLLSSGVQTGERVALLMDNTDAAVYLSTYVAIHRAGAVAVPCNTRFTTQELGHVLTHSEAKLVIHGASHGHRVPDHLATISISIR